jgi:hypothetical protein
MRVPEKADILPQSDGRILDSLQIRSVSTTMIDHRLH